jgi:hypothetical protein
VPRYFFNIVDGTDQPDREGTELANLAECRQEAVRLSGELLRDMGQKFWDDTEWSLTVTDAAGAKVLGLKFSADGRPAGD